MATTTQSTPFPTTDSPPLGSDNGMGTTSMNQSSTGGSSADTIGRMKQSAHDAVDRIADKAGPAMERVRGSVSGMSDSMHARGEQFGAMQEQWLESCRSSVRENPLAAVGIAVVAGMVLSKIMSSK